MIRQHSGENCLVTAAAGLFGISYNELIRLMKVDPNEICWPDEDAPYNTRAVHIQEINYVGLRMGYGAFVPYFPCVMLASNSSVVPVDIHIDMRLAYAFIIKGIMCAPGARGVQHAYIKEQAGDVVYDLQGNYVNVNDDFIQSCYCMLQFIIFT